MTLLLMIAVFALGVALAKHVVKASRAVLSFGLGIFKLGFVLLGWLALGNVIVSMMISGGA